MKFRWLILFLVVVMTACTPSAETRHGASLSDDAIQETHHGTSLPNDGVRETQNLASLQAIDSLMWRRPDSALMVMQGFAGSPEADSLDVFEGHYCQVLISELLYKNYYAQSNRAELMQAVGYFDSIVGTDGADARGASPQRGASSQERDAFLDARAHYINGAGLYEQGDVVEACAEYLKALEVMEGRFEEKELVGRKAAFMFYLYNRLLELFSEQFMMDPALACGENALTYCRKVPSLSNEISNTYCQIGKQYDKKGEIDIARCYYEMAIEEMSDTNSPVYRDAVSMKALCDYQLGLGVEQLLNTMKQSLVSIKDERERVARFLVIGSVYLEEGIYDSALRYFEFAYKDETDAASKIRAAEGIRVVYDSLGDREKSNEFMRYMTNHRESEGESKALTSQLENMFKAYTEKKQEKEAEKEREKSIRKTIGIIVPIALLIALAIIVMAKRRSRKLLLQQQEDADRVLGETEQAHEEELRRLQAETKQRLEEAERKHRQKVAEMEKRYEEELSLQKDHREKEIEQIRQRHEAELEAERLAYEKEQEALRQNLQQRETQINTLNKALDQQRQEAAKHRTAFRNEAICRRILDLVDGKRITSRDSSFQHGIGLKEEDSVQLKEAVERHYSGFDNMMRSRCAGLKQSDLTLCHLHLLGLNEGEIGALRDRTYSAIKKQNESLQERLGIEENISAYVLRLAEELSGTQNVEQEIQMNMTLQRTAEGNSGHFDTMGQESSLKSSLKSSQKILELISVSPCITISEIADNLGMTKRGVDKNIKILKEQGVIRRVGPDKGGHWEVIE